MSAFAVAAAAGVWLLAIVAVAAAADRGWIPRRVSRHPLTHALGLGVYASTWSYYGSVGFASTGGLSYLAIYLGPTLACILVPVLWAPVLRLTREHQLSSLADLFAFRFRRPAVGVLTTLALLAGSLPYLAQQIRAVAASLGALGFDAPPALLALGYTALLTAFAVFFGTRHLTPRDRHDGLVAAIAAESLLKLVALLAVGLVAAFGVLRAADGWQAPPAALEALEAPLRDGPWATLLFLSFAAAFLLPRQFHLAFTESGGERALRTSAWAFPLYLLLLNLPILPILWAGQHLDPGGNADLYVLRVAEASPALTLLAFVGGLSAASAMAVVTALALASMAMNHLVLPAVHRPRRDLYGFVRHLRRLLVAGILLGAFCFGLLDAGRGQLVDLGLVSFVAVAQFVPGLLALLFWPRASASGFLAGLGGGTAVWAATLLLPVLARGGLLPDWLGHFGAAGLDGYAFATAASVGANALLLGAVSLWRGPDAAEAAAARACRREAEAPQGLVGVEAARAFADRLAPFLGAAAAQSELQRALDDLGIEPDEDRPEALRRLRDRIERNLSGLLGPLVARVVVDEGLRLDPEARLALADHFRHLEVRLRRSQSRLDGLTAELDGARRWLHTVLQELPLGACVLGPGGEVVVWNRALACLAGVQEAQAAGVRLEALGPLGGALASFAAGDAAAAQVHQDGRHLSLHRASLAGGGLVLLVEDRTERAALEAHLAHHERLASIGRVAAGVAHEIGNPLTGISCVAQGLKQDPEDLQARLDLILGEAARIDAIVRTLLSFSHRGETGAGAADRVALAPVVEEAVRVVRLGARSLAAEVQIPAELLLVGDRGRLVQVFVNLLQNACDASPPGASVAVRARATGAMVAVEVIDRGAGIDPAHLDRLFEPFFTTRGPGAGTGLGLSLVHGIVRDHGGRIEVESEPGRGSLFRVWLPAAAAEAAA